MKETTNEGNVLITVKDEKSQEKTNISLPYFYDISSEVIENIKAVEGVFEIQAVQELSRKLNGYFEKKITSQGNYS